MMLLRRRRRRYRQIHIKPRDRRIGLVPGLLLLLIAGLLGGTLNHLYSEPGVTVAFTGVGGGVGNESGITSSGPIADIPVPTAPRAAEAANLKVNLKPTGEVKSNRGNFAWKSGQLANAAIIVDVGMNTMGMRCRAWVIAVATSMQESTLHNYGNLGARNDHDSLGLFQQRPSAGWGKPKQIMDRRYAAKKFYQGLKRKVPDYDTRRLTNAAQAVQISAYPNAYQKHETDAKHVVRHVLGLPMNYKFPQNSRC